MSLVAGITTGLPAFLLLGEPMVNQLGLLDTVKHPIRKHTLSDGRIYETSYGFFPSVTTVLDKTMSDQERDRLRKWQHKMDQLRAKTETSDKPKPISATHRGTKIHEMIHHTFLGGAPKPDSDVADYWAQAQIALRMIKIPLAYEQRVFHPNLKYAGTFDLLCDWRGKLTLVDWKTSYRIKKKQWLGNAFMQTASYARAYEALYGERINQTLVIVLSPGDNQFFSREDDEVEDDFHKFKRRLDQFWIHYLIDSTDKNSPRLEQIPF